MKLGRRLRELGRRVVLAAALVAFAVASLAGPLGTVCLCLGGPEPVAVGSCCCDPSGGPRGAGPEGDAMRDPSDPCCGSDRPTCVDLRSADEPSRQPDRGDDPVPPADVIATVGTDATMPWIDARARSAALRAPPCPAASPPPRLRVLRC